MCSREYIIVCMECCEGSVTWVMQRRVCSSVCVACIYLLVPALLDTGTALAPTHLRLRASAVYSSYTQPLPTPARPWSHTSWHTSLTTPALSHRHCHTGTVAPARTLSYQANQQHRVGSRAQGSEQLQGATNSIRHPAYRRVGTLTQQGCLHRSEGYLMSSQQHDASNSSQQDSSRKSTSQYGPRTAKNLGAAVPSKERGHNQPFDRLRVPMLAGHRNNRERDIGPVCVAYELHQQPHQQHYPSLRHPSPAHLRFAQCAHCRWLVIQHKTLGSPQMPLVLQLHYRLRIGLCIKTVAHHRMLIVCLAPFGAAQALVLAHLHIKWSGGASGVGGFGWRTWRGETVGDRSASGRAEVLCCGEILPRSSRHSATCSQPRRISRHSAMTRGEEWRAVTKSSWSSRASGLELEESFTCRLWASSGSIGNAKFSSIAVNRSLFA